jgi:cytidyltransferase-like protein
MKKVLAGGCFNKIHPGHIYFLNKAKALGDYLVVVLAHDRNNKKPYAIPAKERKKKLQELRIADKIIIGHPTDFLKTVKKAKPNIIALGYDQRLGREMENKIKEMKMKTIRIKRFGKYNSRKIDKNL